MTLIRAAVLTTILSGSSVCPWAKAACTPPVTQGLVLALDGSQVRLNDQGAVRVWVNQTLGGGTNDALQANPHQQPRLDTVNTLNGHPVLVFNGTPGTAGRDELVAGSLRRVGEATVFAVARRDRQTSGGSMLRPILTAGHAESTFSLGVAEEGAPTTVRADYAGMQAVATLPRLDDGDYLIFCALGATGTLRTALYVNGVRIASATVPRPPRAFGPIVIGGQSGSDERHFRGAIAEILVYDTALSDDDRRRVETYLGDKYGLDVLPLPRQIPGELFVAIGHPAASDRNPGTRERPFKTLRRAGDVAMPGDRISVGAGLYREPLTVRASGSYDGTEDGQRIVFRPDGDAAVILDGSETVAPSAWQPVEGSARVYVADLKAALPAGCRDPRASPIRYVFVDHRPLPPCRVPSPEAGKGLVARSPQDADTNTWGFDEKTDRLTVNLGGDDPRKGPQVDVAVRDSCIALQNKRLVTVAGFTVRRANVSGIHANDSRDVIIEDCAVEYAHNAGIAVAGARGALVRRCHVRHIGGIGIHSNGARDAEISENTVFSWYENPHGLLDGYNKVAFTVFGGRFNQYYHNVAVMPTDWTFKGGGFWTDCAGLGHVYMGNATRHTWNSGFYIESPADNNLVKWNTVTDFRHQGIYLRSNRNNLVAENYVADGGSALVLSSTEDSMVANNLFSHNWVRNVNNAISVGPEPGGQQRQTLNYFQRNTYDVATNLPAFASWGGVSYGSLEAFTKATGQETLGRAETINPDALGMAYVRVDEPGLAHDPIPMIANPRFDRDGSRLYHGLYFWLRGDADGYDSFPEWPRPGANYPFTHEGFRDQRSRRINSVQTCGNRWAVVPNVPGTPVGGTCFEAYSLTDKAADARGAGVWSPTLPVVGGAELELEFWLRGDNVRPVTNSGGIAVYVEWSDWTGQNRSRTYVVGGEDGTMARPEMNQGTFAWTNVAAVVQAPAGARRLGLYFGLRSAHGVMGVDAVETFRQRPGKAPATATAAAAADTPPAPLIPPEALAFASVDLSGVVNRALADEVAGDGAGGWTDQGTGYDMKGLATGRRTHEGVPFDLLAPKTCVVLRSPQRPAGNLPPQVALPVGAKADILYFLHSGAWLTSGATHWSYVVRYADGSSVTLPVIGGANVRDWSQAGDATPFPRTPGQRVTVWPDKVGNVVSPECGLYRLDWVNPHPERQIATIEMVAAEDGVPVLIAITRGVKRMN
jgi:parallel beta-helix repeat protein